MKNFKRILVYYPLHTANEPLFKRAISLARNNDASLKLIDVIPEPTPSRDVVETLDLDMMYQRVIEHRQRDLEKLIAPLKADGMDVSCDVHHGKPFIEIIKTVLRGNHDLVMKSGEGKEGLLIGSTAMRLMRNCPVPVWVLRPDIGDKFDRIMVPINVSSFDDDHQELNRRIIELGISIARHEDADLHFVHAWKTFERNFTVGQYNIFAEEFADITRQGQKMIQKQFDEVIANYNLDGIRYEKHLIYGDSDLVIMSLADDFEIDLIVMGTVARTGFDGVFIGNTAELVLRSVKCSVLAIKPDGFESPIKIN